MSKELAVKTLQLEMEYIFGALEDEALDVAQDLEGAGFLLSRYCTFLTSSMGESGVSLRAQTEDLVGTTLCCKISPSR